ncbi:GlxA family transcriptional regulator [Roseovarius spongiae]|uniref:GlxA family transcriptional regulator n=1 Tax=Roseovarius spongiae TaxID=2320272 RepID=A0A3A8AT39_9RHOB|nr:GlxA family transcriptional regulator [Roseovarius spongiae]RKF13598.1 GlxA family transcriptional regulator [Roseovarius spongiae]
MQTAAERATATGTSRQKFRVGVVLLDNFTLNAFSGFIDALRLAADTGGRSRQIECGWVITGHGALRASCGLTVTPEHEPVDPAQLDYIAVAGGNDYMLRRQPAWLDAYLRAADGAGKTLIGLCTGTFNIARAGLMDGRPACVHWNVRDEFIDQFPGIDTVSDNIFLDTGDRITCAGSTGASDLALHLVRRHCGAERAQQSLRHMILNRQRKASSPQPQFASGAGAIRDGAVRRCINLMEQSLDVTVPLAELAARAGLSERQLARRFHDALGQPPSRYYRHLRLSHGAWRLVHTTDPVMQIAVETGFADASHFHREFRRRYGMPPAIYRKAATRREPHGARKA